MREEATFSNRAHDDDDRRDCLPIQIRNKCVWFLCLPVCFYSCTRVTKSYDREHVVSERLPPAIRRARAARPRESVPRALLGRPPRVLGSRPRAPRRLSRDRPPERLRPTRLRSRRGSDKARPWRRPPCRRSWCVPPPRQRPRLSRPRPTGPEAPRARASRRSTSAETSSRTRLERVSNARRPFSRRVAGLSLEPRRRIESTIDHHDADLSTLTFMNDVSPHVCASETPR